MGRMNFDQSRFEKWLKKEIHGTAIEIKDGSIFTTLDFTGLEPFLRKLRTNYPGFRVLAVNGYFKKQKNGDGKQFTLMYHLSNPEIILTLKLELDKKPKEIGSITHLYPEAEVFEREFSEMFGVRVLTKEGAHKKLLLDDLTSTFDEGGGEKIEKQKPLEPQGYCLVPLGPQHPALIEPENFILKVDNERVVEAQVNIGYIHRGIEKLVESRTYIQNIYLIERVCGICSGVHTVTYTKCVELAAGIHAPRRAEYIRTVILELERIHSHMLWLGIFAYEMGQDTLFQYIFRDRERVLERLEEISGNRINYGMSTIGGVRRDITETQAERLFATTKFIRDRMNYYYDVFSGDDSIVSRTENVGRIERSVAERMATGPNLRACGFKADLRKLGYCAYDEVGVHPVIMRKCDVMSVALVRIREIEESCRIIEDCLKKMPSGSLKDKPRVFFRLDNVEQVFRTEAPRGELFYYIKGDTSDKPHRVKIRTPTFTNIQLLPYMLKDECLADVPVIIASIDPCFSCCERLTMVNVHDGGSKIVSINELRRMADG